MQVIYTGEAGKVASRDVLSRTIAELSEKDDRVIYLDADLMSCINTQQWGNAHPERAINVGIAEANMVGVAAGLSLTGFKPIIHSFGPFASRRCFDQVFLSGGYGRNGMTIIGSDPGVTATLNGGTHMPFEDIALYRTIPDATIVEISDSHMIANVLPQLIELPGVKYLRTGRKTAIKVYSEDTQVPIGKGLTLREGKDVTIIACGLMVQKALEAEEILRAEGIEATVVDMFTIKPLDRELVAKCAAETGAIVAAENHNTNGGLCDAVARAVAETCPVPVETVAVEDLYGQVGTQGFLEEEYGLTTAHVVAAAKAAIARKK